MIGGSGPTDRNMNQGQALRTNSFALLTKELAENGIASVRYDKRGAGKSIKAINPEKYKLDDYINDAKLFIDRLSLDNQFSKIIVLGHSEGAMVGLVATLQAKVAAYISLSGFETNMVDIMGEQLKPIISPQDYIVYTELTDSLKAGKILTKVLPASFGGIFSRANQIFLIFMLKYNPSKEISKLKIPLLIIGGSADIQVPAEAAVRLGKMNKKATLKIIPEMNHVLKKSSLDRTSNLATYGDPNLPLHQDLVPILKNFISTVK
jgi:pimeloyl-ACP methyl ester carboxylesterase